MNKNDIFKKLAKGTNGTGANLEKILNLSDKKLKIIDKLYKIQKQDKPFTSYSEKYDGKTKRIVDVSLDCFTENWQRYSEKYNKLVIDKLVKNPVMINVAIEHPYFENAKDFKKYLKENDFSTKHLYMKELNGKEYIITNEICSKDGTPIRRQNIYGRSYGFIMNGDHPLKIEFYFAHYAYYYLESE